MYVGLKNEFDFIKVINNSYINELNPILQDLILCLFPNIQDNDIIYAKKYGKYAKTDIVVTVNDINKGISIKTGYNNSVHIEPIKKFEDKLISYGLSYNYIDLFKRYIYSDGSNDNTGLNRLSNADYLVDHKNEICELNVEFDKLKNILIKRFLIETDIKYKVSVDAFIHGVPNDFLWVTSEEVLSFLENKNANSNSLHSSNLYIQSWNKNLIRNNKYEHCRDYIQVKWFNMFNDMIEIMSNRNLNM